MRLCEVGTKPLVQVGVNLKRARSEFSGAALCDVGVIQVQVLKIAQSFQVRQAHISDWDVPDM